MSESFFVYFGLYLGFGVRNRKKVRIQCSSSSFIAGCRFNGTMADSMKSLHVARAINNNGFSIDQELLPMSVGFRYDFDNSCQAQSN